MSPVGSGYSKSDRPAAARQAQRSRPNDAVHGGAYRLPRDQSLRDVEFIYGRNPVREALRGKRRVHSVLLVTRDGKEADPVVEQNVSDWVSESTGDRPSISHLTHRELTALVRTPDHQGVVAEVDPYPYCDAEELLATRTLLVALDEVQDPHNLGAIIRTAEAAGAGTVIMRHRAAEITAAVVKSAAGATEHAAVARVRNLSDFLIQAKQGGFWIYGAAAGAESDYSTQDYGYPTCFVLGSEGKGLGKRVESLCDLTVSLPLAATVESLNVSVSAGVLLYEALRQRRVGGA